MGLRQVRLFGQPAPGAVQEWLFVYLSRFCEVRYCIARHVGFLAGLGRPVGDKFCPPETVEQVVRLITRPLPRGGDLEASVAYLMACDSPLAVLPDPDTPTEEAIFACAMHIFLTHIIQPKGLEVLRRAFEKVTFQHLLVFLTFVRTAHFWTRVYSLN